MIFRRLFSVSCATLMMTSACDFGIDLTQETDAELFCRQAGFQLESTGYDDCVERSSKLALLPSGDGETDTAGPDDAQPEPSTADSKAATTAHATVSGTPDASKPESADRLTGSDQPSFAAHLSSVRSQAQTEAEWRKLQKRFPELLADRKMIVRSVELEGKGTYFRILTDPFADEGKVQSFCATLESRQQYCLIRRL
jgi:hypothetical protein